MPSPTPVPYPTPIYTPTIPIYTPTNPIYTPISTNPLCCNQNSSSYIPPKLPYGSLSGGNQWSNHMIGSSGPSDDKGGNRNQNSNDKGNNRDDKGDNRNQNGRKN